jgi:hypothetical protein
MIGRSVVTRQRCGFLRDPLRRRGLRVCTTQLPATLRRVILLIRLLLRFGPSLARTRPFRNRTPHPSLSLSYAPRTAQKERLRRVPRHGPFLRGKKIGWILRSVWLQHLFQSRDSSRYIITRVLVNQSFRFHEDDRLVARIQAALGEINKDQSEPMG